MKIPKSQTRSKTVDSSDFSFADHLTEIRNRLLLCVGVFLIGSIVGYVLHEQTLALLVRPLGQTLYYASPSGGFDFVIKISLFFGFLIALPVFLHQLIKFLEPALPKKIPHLVEIVFLVSSVLMLIGIVFAYFVSLPAALYFLNTFSSQEVRALISAADYLSFITRYLLGFGLIFQLPLFMVGYNAISPLNLKKLMQYQRYVIAASFLFAAILTPTPDFFNQASMALPLIILYQISLVIIWYINRKK